MTSFITRIVLVAPFAILLVAAFAIAMLVEAVSDLAGSTHPEKAS
jgi:hypothetical protein